MYTGQIEADPYDLETNIMLGQTFCWFESEELDYYTPINSYDSPTNKEEIILIKEEDNVIHWKSTFNCSNYLRNRLGLNYDHEKLLSKIKNSPFSEDIDLNPELRLVNDPLFQCTVSFITSARMSRERILNVQRELCNLSGTTINLGGNDHLSFPEPHDLVNKSLSSFSLGYREEYIKETSRKFENGFKVEGDDYKADREKLMELKGVGPKVADCVCLYSLGHHQSFPQDTWIKQYVEQNYDYKGNYDKISKIFIDELGEATGLWQLNLYYEESI